jgi:hypothetical protein
MFGAGSSGVYETIYWSKAAGSRATGFALDTDSSRHHRFRGIKKARRRYEEEPRTTHAVLSVPFPSSRPFNRGWA